MKNANGIIIFIVVALVLLFWVLADPGVRSMPVIAD